jgi:hypothetical protein
MKLPLFSQRLKSLILLHDDLPIDAQAALLNESLHLGFSRTEACFDDKTRKVFHLRLLNLDFGSVGETRFKITRGGKTREVLGRVKTEKGVSGALY